MIKKRNKKIISNLSRGFTLIELMVVVSIFAIVTAISIYNYSNFNSSLSIQNLADDIALTVRRAQSFAIGVRGYGGSFNDGYGVHFSANPNSKDYEGSNTSFVLFSDMDTSQNKKYDYNGNGSCGNPTSNNECIEVLSIKSADGIKAIYYNEIKEETKLSDDGTVDILFYRPNPEPQFCIRNNPSYTSCEDVGAVSRIIIEISNLGNSAIYKTITISNNGQISVS